LTNNPEITDHAAIYAAGMSATLKRLIAKSKRVIFVLDIPELGFDPKACVDVRPWRLTSHIKSPCAVSRDEFEMRNRQYRDLVRSVLQNFPTVKVFDAAAELCDKQWCWAMKDGMVLYRDDDHLSVQGSSYVVSGLLKLIQHPAQ
jgi:hypothetical protein